MLSSVSGLEVDDHIILAASVNHTTTTGIKIIAIRSWAPVICVFSLFDGDGSFKVIRQCCCGYVCTGSYRKVWCIYARTRTYYTILYCQLAYVQMLQMYGVA